MYYLYRTTNTVNKKYYIGVTKTEGWYYGSGTALKNAIKKYGYESFEVEKLEKFTTEEEAYEREKEVVTEELVQDRNCYNLKVGGKGGSGQTKSKEHRTKISEAIKKKHAKGTYSESALGRNPVMDKEKQKEFIDTVKEYGVKKTAKIYNLHPSAVEGRYYRYLKKLK